MTTWTTYDMSVVFLGAGTGANRTISCRRPRCNCAPSDVNIPRTKSQDDNVGMIIFHYLTKVTGHWSFSESRQSFRNREDTQTRINAFLWNILWATTGTPSSKTPRYPVPLYILDCNEQIARKTGAIDDLALRTWYLIYIYTKYTSIYIDYQVDIILVYLFHQNARFSVPVPPARPHARSTTALHFIFAIRFILVIRSIEEHFVP